MRGIFELNNELITLIFTLCCGGKKSLKKFHKHLCCAGATTTRGDCFGLELNRKSAEKHFE